MERRLGMDEGEGEHVGTRWWGRERERKIDGKKEEMKEREKGDREKGEIGE